jgi:hypothetical protein
LTAEAAHQAVEDHSLPKLDLVKIFFQDIGSSVDMLVLLVGYRVEEESRLFEELVRPLS